MTHEKQERIQGQGGAGSPAEVVEFFDLLRAAVEPDAEAFDAIDARAASVGVTIGDGGPGGVKWRHAGERKWRTFTDADRAALRKAGRE